jgi:uncharacterized protein (UPF0264 family)
MRLLVSVRSAAEVAAAVAGGAEIVDAKEPARGALGAVSAGELTAIARALPEDRPLSVALGDPADEKAALSAWPPLDRLGQAGEAYVKLGLAETRGLAASRAVLRTVVALAASAPLGPAVVAVAYADGAGPAPGEVSRLAAESGAHGVLLDTWRKDGRDLFACLGESELRRWALAARSRGLFVALAGGLSVESLRRVASLPADIVGVRGAACVGGRLGRVDEGRVRVLRAALSSDAGRSAAIL